MSLKRINKGECSLSGGDGIFYPTALVCLVYFGRFTQFPFLPSYI